MNSIIPQKEFECFICHRFGSTEEHHMICGTAQRKKAERFGLKVNVCRSCHSKIHDKGYKKRELESLAQRYFELTYPDEDFLKIFGRNYK